MNAWFMNRISRPPKPIFANRTRIGIGLARYKWVTAQTLSRQYYVCITMTATHSVWLTHCTRGQSVFTCTELSLLGCDSVSLGEKLKTCLSRRQKLFTQGHSVTCQKTRNLKGSQWEPLPLDCIRKRICLQDKCKKQDISIFYSISNYQISIMIDHS